MLRCKKDVRGLSFLLITKSSFVGCFCFGAPLFSCIVNMNKMQDIKKLYSCNIFCKFKSRLELIKSLYIKYKMTDF